ncbi:CHAP domain-containing protein [Prosthecochloris sp. N2]|nr:CHAP domain-containing protein [Prosthecochloris ethylica]NUK48687.1 CHAP domain-containing protein [Prosthecochloris ethylica]
MGSIIVWLDRNNTTNQSGYGHVAVVNRIDWGKKEIYISEMNWGPLMPGTNPEDAITINFDSTTTIKLSLENLNRKGRVSTYHFQGHIKPIFRQITEKEVLNASINDIALVNGEYQQGEAYFLPPNNKDYFHIWICKDNEDNYLLAFGDVNNDESLDAAAITCFHGGGNAVFKTLNIFTNIKGNTVLINTLQLGLFVIENVSIRNNLIIIETIEHKTTDPRCCPSLHKLRYFTIENEKLAEKL